MFQLSVRRIRIHLGRVPSHVSGDIPEDAEDSRLRDFAEELFVELSTHLFSPTSLGTSDLGRFYCRYMAESVRRFVHRIQRYKHLVAGGHRNAYRILEAGDPLEDYSWLLPLLHQ